MSKLPRNINGIQLAKSLRKYGYKVVRQTGSHIRLTSTFKGYEHKITIPAHNPLKVGTLNAILKEISNYLEISKEELIKEIF
ncbi:MAG: type II toxin-antitoxin system HicA family toxin [Persephonella sp.]|nr:type II toxin-antitoxin system HicA family toxin [Persephonella sp.]